MNSKYPFEFPKKKVFGGLFLLILLIFTVATVATSWRTVPAGYKGVRTTWGRVTGIAHEGGMFVWGILGERLELMDVQIHEYTTTETAASIDLQSVTTEITVNYRLMSSHVQEIWQTLRRDYENRVLKPNIDESLKASTAEFAAEDLILRREDVKHRFLDILQDRIAPYHIEILGVSITDFKFSSAFMEAIDRKVTTVQNALAAEALLEQIKYEAQQKIIQAAADKNATILRAEATAMRAILEANGTAQALLLEKYAEAEAIEVIMAQLEANPEYLEYLAILAWNGQLPNLWSGDVLPFIQLPTNMTAP